MTLDNILTILGSNVIVSFLSYFTGRRMSQAQSDNQVLRNLEISIGLYKQVIDDLKIEISALKTRIQELEDKIDELHKENKLLKAGL